MLKTIVTTSLVLLLAAQSQNQRVRFSLQVEEGIQYAKKNDKPIMFYVRGSSGGDDDIEDYERDHVRAFADPDVTRLAGNFVCLQMSRSRYRGQLTEWGLSPRTNLNIVFASSTGERIDEPLAASAVASPKTLAAKMRQNIRRWSDMLYKDKVEPVLGAEDSSVRDLRDALKLIEQWQMRQADKAVLGLLDREKLDRTTRTAVLSALGGIGSQATIDRLIELSLEKDRLADKALADASTAAVEPLLQHLGGEDADKHVVAYTALTKICRISGAKPQRFWQGSNHKVQVDEVERVRGIAEKKLAEWKKDQP